MKKVLKKLPLLILALVLVLAIKDKTYAATYGKLTYEVKNDGTIKITDCDTNASGALTIPDTIDGKKVTSIGQETFFKCSSLTSITIPDSVTSIGEWAFLGCSSLTSITIPNSVTSIGDRALYGCSSLASINVSDNNKYYCDIDGILFNKDKTEIIKYPEKKEGTAYQIPNSVTSIENEAFYGCSSLASITIPNSVTSIGDRAFEDCIKLTSITIPNSVTSIGDSAFENCIKLTSITIPNSVTSIGYYAFSGCSSLTSITIPEGVTSIGYDAFYNCSNLTSITIPNSVTSIGGSAFSGCGSLASINVLDNNKYYCDIDGVLFNKDKTEIIKYPGKKEGTAYQIPNSVTSIENEAFRGCSSLTSITIPEGVTSIGNYAFYNCSNLTSITIPEGVTSIGNYAFYNCSNLTSITIPNSVTSIGDSAFYYCSSLTSITIPEGVTSIGDNAFWYCNSLTSITIPNSVTSIGDNAFTGCSSLTGITIPNCVTSIENDAFRDCSSLTSITIPNSVTSIGNSAFEWCSNLTSITIPNSVTSIGNEAFKYCDSLTSITIPESVTSIGDSAFYYCSSLASITIPEGVKSIGNGAFYNCNDLTSITIQNGVTSIGDEAFYDCSSLASITIPKGVTSIGNEAFKYCDSLTSITIPESVTSIGDSAFYGCSSLASINVSDNNKYYCDIDGILFNKDKTEIIKYPGKKEGTAYQIPNSVTSIGDSAFRWCSNLTNIAIPDSVTSIGDEAFSYCGILTSITIPNSVTSIGNRAFAWCGILTSVTIPEGVTSIGNGAFIYCENLTSITILSSVTSIGSKSFYYCDSLSKVLCLGNAPKLGSDSFDGCSSDLKIYAKNGLTGYDANGWENYSDKIVRYNEALKKNSVIFKSRKQTEKIEMVDDTVFKEIASIKSYEIEDKSIASIDSSGKVTPLKNGKTNVKAVVQYFDGTEVNLTEEIVVDFKAESISLDKTNITLNNNKPVKLNEKVLPEETNNKKVNWKSSNEKVATVDENGNVTAVVSENPVGQGTCKITATTADGTNLSASCDVTVDIKAESIGFSLTSYTITNLGQTPSFKPKILPENTANKNVTWKSSNTNIATVNPSTGVIKAVSSGTCKITATTTDGTNLSASMDIIVDIKAKSVAFDKTSMQITSQNSINKLVATVTPSQASQKVAWSSSNGKIATVDSKGRVKAVSNGKCKIIATTTDGTNKTASCDVTVDVKFVTGISFDFNSYTITNVNQTPVFRPNITPSDAEDKNVRWSSSNTKVATVSSSGVIKAAGNGTCKITATTTDGTNLSASFNITVNIKATKITLDKTKIELTTGKETEKITSSIEPSIANKAVKYTSSDESVATVSSDGVVTAVGSGTCRIIATTTDGSEITASCDVTVDIKTTGMKLDKTNYTFNKAETIKINPVITPSKASKKLTWTSSNTKVAIVSSDGKVTPVGKGTCKITATTTDETNLSASCDITSNVEYQKGDVNRDGKVNVSDVLYTMNKYMKGILTEEEKVIAEVTGDGKVNMNDVYRILAYAMGKISSL